MTVKIGRGEGLHDLWPEQDGLAHAKRACPGIIRPLPRSETTSRESKGMTYRAD